ncbi:MAG: class I SAM-dependent methyltransferase [Thermoplasmatota archaeon]
MPPRAAKTRRARPYVGDPHMLEAQRRTFFPADFGATVAERVGIAPGSRVLDLGAGGGFLARALARTRPLGIVGADLAPAALAFARAEARAAGHRWHDYVAADATRLPFGDAVFDAAVCLTLLCVVPEPVAVLAEMARVSRERVGAIEWVAPMSFANPADPSREALLQERGAASRAGFAKRFHADHDLGARLPALFRDAGLKRVRASGLTFAFSFGDPTRPLAARLELARAALAESARASPDTYVDGGMSRASWKRLEISTRKRLQRFVREPESMDRDVEWSFVHVAVVVGDV